METSIFGAKQDKKFMCEALKQAHKAGAKDEVPVGAIVVDAQGAIICRGYNQVETHSTQCAHAEMRALQKAGKKIGDWRLEGCWLYVTLKPCIMCMGLIYLSRLDGVVYGADSPLFGYRLDKVDTSRVYKEDTLAIVAGVCAEQAASLLKWFFQDKRKKR